LSPVQRETDEILGMVVFAVVLVMIFILILGAIYYFGVQRSKPAETVVIPEAETATSLSPARGSRAPGPGSMKPRTCMLVPVASGP